MMGMMDARAWDVTTRQRISNETVIIQTIIKLWNKSKESLMPRSRIKQVRVSPKVPPNNQESINVYQCSVQRVYN
jgi:hypothetical protein